MRKRKRQVSLSSSFEQFNEHCESGIIALYTGRCTSDRDAFHCIINRCSCVEAIVSNLWPDLNVLLTCMSSPSTSLTISYHRHEFHLLSSNHLISTSVRSRVDASRTVSDNLLYHTLLLQIRKRSAGERSVDLQTIDEDGDCDETV